LVQLWYACPLVQACRFCEYSLLGGSRLLLWRSQIALHGLIGEAQLGGNLGDALALPAEEADLGNYRDPFRRGRRDRLSGLGGGRDGDGVLHRRLGVVWLGRRHGSGRVFTSSS
jgi:hypothetical protein